MRLLHTRTLKLHSFMSNVPDYAILSHRWENEEVTFIDDTKDPISDVNSPSRLKAGFPKVQGTCALAARDGFEWVWIDTLCIDKTSSAELQESINSMFKWYAEAELCYAYLSDVADTKAGWGYAFQSSAWFTRAWTLQELIAPLEVEFYAADWSPIGSKRTRHEELTQITGIASKALTCIWSQVENSFVAAEKLSWAACRQATRGEDESYSLLGLFDVNLAMLYGEGQKKAFHRLQLAIYERDIDQSLFLFAGRCLPRQGSPPLLADDPSAFCQRKSCSRCFEQSVRHYYQFEFSQLSSVRPVDRITEGDFFIKVLRDGIMVRLPMAKVADLPTNCLLVPDGQLSNKENLSAASQDFVVAVLNVANTKYGHAVLPLLGEKDLYRPRLGPLFLSFQCPQDQILDRSVIVAAPNLDPPNIEDALVSIELNTDSFTNKSWQVRGEPYGHMLSFREKDKKVVCSANDLIMYIRLEVTCHNPPYHSIWLDCDAGAGGDIGAGRMEIKDIGVQDGASTGYPDARLLRQSLKQDDSPNKALMELPDRTTIHASIRALKPTRKYAVRYQIHMNLEEAAEEAEGEEEEEEEESPRIRQSVPSY